MYKFIYEMGKKVKELKKHKEDFALRPVFNWWKNIFMLLTISWDVVKKKVFLFLLNNLLNANSISLAF